MICDICDYWFPDILKRIEPPLDYIRRTVCNVCELHNINTDTYMINISCGRCGKNSLLTVDVTGDIFCGSCGYVQIMKKYKIQLSMYGTVAERADIVIEAITEKEAMKKAIRLSEEGLISFSHNNEAVDGWEYQVEDIEKIQ